MDTKESAGSDNHDMHWPVLETTRDLQRIKSWQKFRVIFTLVGGSKTWELKPSSAAEFVLYKTGERWKLEVNRAGKVKPLRRIKAEVE